MSDKKKTYAAPTITDHGKITQATQGVVGEAWEYFGSQPPPSDGPTGGK